MKMKIMKVYKFYKDDCPPCSVLSSILSSLELNDVEIIPVDVQSDDGMKFARSKGVSSVPTMIRDDGVMMVGMRGKDKVSLFLNGGNV